MRIRDYLIYIFITIYSLFLGIYQISLILHRKEDANSYLWISLLCTCIIFWSTALVTWVKKVSFQKAEADPLVDSGQEHSDKSSSATFPPNVESTPKEHHLFFTAYFYFIGIYQIFLVLHGRGDFNSYFWIFMACIWTVRWVTALVRWVKEHRFCSKLFTKQSSS